MTRYLLDTNVLSKIDNPYVVAWLKGVADSDIAVSVINLIEIRKGYEKLAKTDPTVAAKGNATIDAFRQIYEGRIIAVDGDIADEWGRLVGRKDSDRFDLGMAAIARVRDMVVVSRNVKDFEGRGVRVLNPFMPSPSINGS